MVVAALVALTLALGPPVDRAAARAHFSGEVAVAKHGRIVFARGYGLANRARGTRVTLDTAFNLASIGKTFTGVAAAQLVQAGKLRFSDPVTRYLPRLPARFRAITVGELLDHTAGLGDLFDDPGFDPRGRGDSRRSPTSSCSSRPARAGRTATPGSCSRGS